MIKQNISKTLKKVGLEGFVSLKEIEKEISKTETPFQSRLLLGILSRIMHTKDDEAARLFIPAVTEWKNYLPHKDLDGLSPAEYLEKYPPGPYERRFISELVNEYHRRLEINPQTGRAEVGSPDEFFDVEADFDRFREEYLNRIPLEQPFVKAGGGLMTIKEIIIEERRRNGCPERALNKISIKIFAENTAEGLGMKMAAIEDAYYEAMQELVRMQNEPSRRSRKRVRAIRKQFERDEPYHRCSIAPHQFYLNYAMVLFLDDVEIEKVISLLDRALSYKPDYKQALEMKRRLLEW